MKIRNSATAVNIFTVTRYSQYWQKLVPTVINRYGYAKGYTPRFLWVKLASMQGTRNLPSNHTNKLGLSCAKL